MTSISTDVSDDDLIQSLRSGQQEALGILFERYGSLVYTVAIKFLKYSDEAEDLTQEIFLSLKNKEKFDPNRGELSTYLCLMVRSMALNRLARDKAQRKSLQKLKRLEIIPNRASITPLEQASQVEKRETLKQALSALPDRNRQILEMNFYQGLSHSEISSQLKLPLGTVKSHARKGLMLLRQALGEAVK